MSIGSTQSFFSICRMRFSAEIGSENTTRSTRVRRENSMKSSTRAEFLQAAAGVGRAVIAAIVENADHAHVAVRLRAQHADQTFAVFAAADHDRAAREPALPHPAPHDGVERETRRQQAIRPKPKKLANQTREKSSPSFPKKVTAVPSRKTIDQAETSFAIWLIGRRKAWIS